MNWKAEYTLISYGVPPLGGVKQGRCGKNKLFSSYYNYNYKVSLFSKLFSEEPCSVSCRLVGTDEFSALIGTVGDGD